LNLTDGWLDRALESAQLAAARAAEVHLAGLGSVQDGDVVSKSRSDFVSQVDLDAQRVIIDVLRERHPDHEVLGEEMSEQEQASRAQTSAPLWVIDPLDGTTNFLHGHPFFGASVALVVDGQAVVGVVDSPLLSERWWARRRGGAWLQRRGEAPRRLRTSAPDSLARALIATGFPFKALHLLPEYLGQFERVLSNTAGIRRCGAAAVDLCYLASGRVDAFWEGVLKPWDIAAGAVIVREAGGVVERVDGAPLDFASGSVLAAGSRASLEGLRRLLKG